MILRSAHGKRVDVVVASDSCEVVPQADLSCRGNELPALLCAEDNVKNGADVGVRHRYRHRKGDDRRVSVTRVTERSVAPEGARDRNSTRTHRSRGGLNSFVPPAAGLGNVASQFMSFETGNPEAEIAIFIAKPTQAHF